MRSIAHHVHVFLLLALSLVLTSCTIPRSRAEFRPTIGPVRDGSGGPGGPSGSLSASTNCTEIGETITLTATLANQSPYSLKIQGTPPLDIIIRPSQWQEQRSAPLVRWSQSDQYPRDFNLVLQPGEKRAYQWVWTVDQQFARPASHQGNVLITFQSGGLQNESEGGSPAGEVATIAVGLGVLEYGGQSRRPCAELRRSVTFRSGSLPIAVPKES